MCPFPETTGFWKPPSRNCTAVTPRDRMARSDLLVSLVCAGTVGDKRSFRSAAEAIIAEERAKHHNVLADTLTEVIHRNGSGGPNGPNAVALVQNDASP